MPSSLTINERIEKSNNLKVTLISYEEQDSLRPLIDIAEELEQRGHSVSFLTLQVKNSKKVRQNDLKSMLEGEDAKEMLNCHAKVGPFAKASKYFDELES